MLTAVKNQSRVLFLSIKYNIMREMTNHITFITNILFMILNNASFIVQWLILFQLKEDIGGYTLNDVMLLWGLAASTFGISHVFFNRAFNISDLIVDGKLDSFLVQPKSVLLSVISSSTSCSAIGDFIYGYLILVIFQYSFIHFLLFTLLSLTGAIILTSFAVIIGSLSFWIVKGDMVSGPLNNLMINFSTYPDGIFKGITRLLIYTIFPVGLTAYVPVKVILHFNPIHLLIILLFTAFILCLAFLVFYRGLKRYSSSNLMSARI